jgi:hypothetical protein
MNKLPTKVTRKKLDKDEMKILAEKVRKTLEEENAYIEYEPISKHEVKSSFGRKLIKHLT